MKTITLISAIAASLFFSSCGSGSSWSDLDKNNLKKNAMSMAKSDPAFTTDEQRTKFCECLLEKTMIASPNPLNQINISAKDALKMNEDCRTESTN